MKIRLLLDHETPGRRRTIPAGSFGEVVSFSREPGDGIVFHVLFYGHPHMYLLNPEDVEAL